MRSKVFIVITFVVFAILSCHYGTGAGEQIITPSEFVNTTKFDFFKYEKDKKVIQETILSFVRKHEGAFYSDEYFDSTEIIVDTILYNTGYDKMSAFIVSKNPQHRKKFSNKKAGYYYDAFCYLGIRVKDSIQLRLLDPFIITNADEYGVAAENVKQTYFREFAVLKDSLRRYRFDYNLNDKRFWTTSIWDSLFSVHKETN